MLGVAVRRFRLIFWTLIYRLLGKIIFESGAKGSRFEGFIDTPVGSRNIHLGKNCLIMRRCSFLVQRSAKMRFGDNVFIGDNVYISVHSCVEIGADTLIAPYVKIYDNNHLFTEVDTPIAMQSFESNPVIIERNVWIGCNSIVLPGVRIGEGSVIGAGAVVTKSIPRMTVAVGNPAKVIKSRD